MKCVKCPSQFHRPTVKTHKVFSLLSQKRFSPLVKWHKNKQTFTFVRLKNNFWHFSSQKIKRLTNYQNWCFCWLTNPLIDWSFQLLYSQMNVTIDWPPWSLTLHWWRGNIQIRNKSIRSSRKMLAPCYFQRHTNCCNTTENNQYWKTHENQGVRLSCRRIKKLDQCSSVKLLWVSNNWKEVNIDKVQSTAPHEHESYCLTLCALMLSNVTAPSSSSSSSSCSSSSSSKLFVYTDSFFPAAFFLLLYLFTLPVLPLFYYSS